MPKRSDIKTILIVGAGPIVIGQACEFDYSGTQACKALKNEGYKIILVNSNPATIMTDPDVADKTYIEPITPEILKKIISLVRVPHSLQVEESELLNWWRTLFSFTCCTYILEHPVLLSI